MEEKGWSRHFDDPIALPDGRELVTLRDAGNYIAAQCLLAAVEKGGGLVMMARIAVVRALNHGKEAQTLKQCKRAKAYKIVR